MNLNTLAIVITGLLSQTFPMYCAGVENGYRLLELDGYKVKWGERRLGVAARISYAFADQTLQFEDAINCGELTPLETLADDSLSMETLALETAAAFRAWERAAALSFYQVDDAREADIIIGAQGKPTGRAFANVTYALEPQDDVRAIEQSLVCLNPEHKWKVGFDGDKNVYDIRYTLIHEIGHAIGLDHPGPSGQVMAFDYTESFDELQDGDLSGATLLYGPATPSGTDTTAHPASHVSGFTR